MPLRFQPARGASVLISSSSRGPTGAAATIAVGSVSALAAGATPTVTNTGSSAAATFAFGIPRGADAGIKWLYDSSTSMADPGSGDIRFNHATLSSVTAIALSATGSGSDVSDYVATWDDSTNTLKGHIIIREEAGSVAAVFSISAVTDNGDWLQLTVAYVSGSLSLTAADPLYLTFYRVGDAGAVSGPASSQDNAAARWNGTTGTSTQDSNLIIEDDGVTRPSTAATVATLGSTANPWTGLYLGNGGLVNFNNGDVTITHSTNALTFAGSTGYSFDNKVIALDTIELGNASDTTLSRVSAGVVAVEGINVALNSTGFVHTANTYEVGNTTDTTISRASAGVIAVEGVTVSLNSTAATHTAGTIELGGTDTTLSRGAAGHLAVEGVKVALVGKQTIYVPAAAMVSANTNGAEAATFVTSTNAANIKTLAFDTTTQEYAHFNVAMPKNWDEGVVTFQASWFTTLASTDGVAWGLEAVSISDNDALDVAWGTQVVVTDHSQSAANELYVTAESTSVTPAGTPAAGDTTLFRLSRVVGNAADVLATDARLVGIRLHYNTDAPTDA